MARNWRWWWPTPKPYTVQPVLYYFADRQPNFQAPIEIMDAMEKCSDFCRETMDGYTFRYEDVILHKGVQNYAEAHFQNALWEVPKVDPCDPRIVFCLFMQGPANQPVGAVGPEYWGCANTIPPGRVLAFWDSGRIGDNFGWLLHELGHCWALGHPVSPIDPRASGPNVMGGGLYHRPPEPVHVLDIPILKASPWFSRR